MILVSHICHFLSTYVAATFPSGSLVPEAPLNVQVGTFVGKAQFALEAKVSLCTISKLCFVCVLNLY